jgi:hypothetical protein
MKEEERKRGREEEREREREGERKSGRGGGETCKAARSWRRHTAPGAVNCCLLRTCANTLTEAA